MSPRSVDRVRAVVHRLFIAAEATRLRKEDEQKCAELAALLPLVGEMKAGAHLVDAASGKASVGLVVAELGTIGKLTAIERAPDRLAACVAAHARLTRDVTLDARAGELGDPSVWPARPDGIVALHACGGAADAVIDGAIRSEARRLWLVPCCYGSTVPFLAEARRKVAATGWAHGADLPDLLARRMVGSLVDHERRLRLEAGGFETRVEELVAPTVTPHNLVFRARRTLSAVRMERATQAWEALVRS